MRGSWGGQGVKILGRLIRLRNAEQYHWHVGRTRKPAQSSRELIQVQAGHISRQQNRHQVVIFRMQQGLLAVRRGQDAATGLRAPGRQCLGIVDQRAGRGDDKDMKSITLQHVFVHYAVVYEQSMYI